MSEADRRRFPRYSSRLNATIPALEEDTCDAMVRAISRAGVELRCNSWSSHRLMSLSRDDKTGKPVTIDVLVTGILENDTELRLPCHVIASRRLSEDAWDLVLEYTDIDAETQERIDAFISSKFE